MRTFATIVMLLLAMEIASAGAGERSSAASPRAQDAALQEALARMPVREATIFKDGHAFMLHQGGMPVDAAGNVVMDYLPTPVLGTFWPFSADRGIKLQAVIAGQRKVLIDRTALSLRDLIEANVGAEVLVTEAPSGREQQPYSATIVSIPVQSGVEIEDAGPPGAGPRLPVKGEVVVLKTADGLKVLDLARIQDVTFRSEIARSKLGTEEFRNLLTLKLDWNGERPASTAEVGLMYMQRGLRWIPQYRITIDGKGHAAVKLQATLVNEMVDLEDVTCRLVIGAPNFTFQDQIDPIALQQTLVGLSRQSGMGGGQFSNALMTQAAGQMRFEADESRAAAPAADLGPEVSAAGRSEDLYVFTVEHVTLKKGQRMVLPVKDATLSYEDVYTLDIPFAPPPEVRANTDSEQQLQIARLLASPKVMHKLRFTNGPEGPLTTAPALIFRDEQALAQGLMTYTPAGGKVDLEVTAAVDVTVSRSDNETARIPNAVVWQNDAYGKVEVAGTISLTSFREDAVNIEVTRKVLGNATRADNAGKVERLNVLDEDTAGRPFWWQWYSWPYWWHHFNGMGRITWHLRLEPGTTADLGYSWNYYWR